MNSSPSTTSAHTPGTWWYEAFDDDTTGNEPFIVRCHAARETGPHVEAIATVLLHDSHAQAEANARLIAAAPDGHVLALIFRNACETRLSLLNDEMVAGQPDACEEDLDDLQDQIGHWNALLALCDAYLAKAGGR